jgi:PBP1b-binding outer membrane lipoprotein LpoB
MKRFAALFIIIVLLAGCVAVPAAPDTMTLL